MEWDDPFSDPLGDIKRAANVIMGRAVYDHLTRQTTFPDGSVMTDEEVERAIEEARERELRGIRARWLKARQHRG